MCCRYYYEDFERELRELMRAEAVVKLPEFLGRKQPELVCEQDSGQIRMDFGL